MGNSTTFLTQPAGGHIDSVVMHDQRFVDFSVENVLAAGTIDVLRLPAGAMVLACGAHAVTHQDTVTYLIAAVDSTGSTTLMDAVAHTADNQNKSTSTGGALGAAGAANMTMNSSGGTLRVTIGAATASTAKITFWCTYVKMVAIA